MVFTASKSLHCGALWVKRTLGCNPVNVKIALSVSEQKLFCSGIGQYFNIMTVSVLYSGALAFFKDFI